MIEYAYDFNFEKCFVCCHCKYDIKLRQRYCELTKERIIYPHAGKCGEYKRV